MLRYRRGNSSPRAGEEGGLGGCQGLGGRGWWCRVAGPASVGNTGKCIQLLLQEAPAAAAGAKKYCSSDPHGKRKQTGRRKRPCSQPLTRPVATA